MIYKGPETDTDRGSKSADQYGLLTNNMLDTLKIHGNILVSVPRYMGVLNNIGEKKFNKTIDIDGVEKVSAQERLFLGKCHKELLAELTRLTGFKKFTFRRIEPNTKEQLECLIIERVIGGDTDGC